MYVCVRVLNVSCKFKLQLRFLHRLFGSLLVSFCLAHCAFSAARCISAASNRRPTQQTAAALYPRVDSDASDASDVRLLIGRLEAASPHSSIFKYRANVFKHSLENPDVFTSFLSLVFNFTCFLLFIHVQRRKHESRSLRIKGQRAHSRA
jgi:hypothetical protein